MTSRTALGWIAAGVTVGLGAAALGWQTREQPIRGALIGPSVIRRFGRNRNGAVQIEAARSLNRGAGLLAVAVALDSAAEHYRGDFRNRAMYMPLLVSTLSLLASGHGYLDEYPQAHRVRDVVYLGTGLTGLAGTVFHLYNLSKRPGGWSWSNLFYGAPLGAPSALVLSGLLGYYAERVRNASTDQVPMVFGRPAGEAVALMAAGGLLGTTLEAALLHFRGAFHNPAMYLPVVAPPLAAGLLAATALAGPRKPRLRWLSRLALRFTTLIGLVGPAFHAWGIARANGGWHNWRQNLQAGPPLPAPPSFTGLSLAGLAAHTLLEEERHLARYRWWQ